MQIGNNKKILLLRKTNLLGKENITNTYTYNYNNIIIIYIINRNACMCKQSMYKLLKVLVVLI